MTRGCPPTSASMLTKKADCIGGVLVEVVEHLARLRFALELHDDAHALAVGLVAQLADAADFFILDQLGDALDQGRLVDLVGELGDHYLLVLRAGGVLHEGLGLHQNAPVAGGVGQWMPSVPSMVPPVGKSGP